MNTLICTHCGTVIRKGDPARVSFFTCEDCREDIRTDHPLREVVFEEISTRLAHRRGGYDKYYCPFHNDVHDPSFWVYENTCHCEAGCKINGKDYGDVFDFIAEYYHLSSFQAAAEKLGKNLPIIVPNRSYEPKIVDDPVTMEEVVRLHMNAAEALAWFTMRGVTPFTVDEKLLGMRSNYRDFYTFRTGLRRGEKVWNTSRYYSIPNVTFGVVQYCKLRRDDQYSMDQLRLIDPRLREEIREDIRLCAQALGRPGEVSDELLMESVFRRYPQLRHPLNANALFNTERVVRHTGNRVVEYIHLPYILIHEGEIKALVMEDCCDDPDYGYPSLSNKLDERVASAVRNVDRVIYVKDRSKDKTSSEVVERHRLWIPRLEVIEAPEGLKAADDVVLAGQVHPWMSSFGIEPVRLERHRGR